MVLLVTLFFYKRFHFFVFTQRVLCYFIGKIKCFYFFSLLSGFFAILLVKYFSVEQKQSHEGVLSKRCLTYLLKFIRKHLCWSPFFESSCRMETCNFIKKKLWHRCFFVNFATKKNIFSEKAPLQMFDPAINTPYPLAGIGRKG